MTRTAWLLREIRAVASGIVAADNRRDAERVLAYYAADAVLMPPGEAHTRDRASGRGGTRWGWLGVRAWTQWGGLESEGVWRISHLIWHRQSESAPSPLVGTKMPVAG
jgi:hypothetical protein